MPLTITRTATVYRLWDNDDLRELFNTHAPSGWVCSLVCHYEDGATVWGVRLQNNDTRQLLSAHLDHLVVSDLVTVTTQTVADYNLANPEQPIEELGS